MGRYDGRNKLTNTTRFYADYMDERGVSKIVQFDTPKLRYPTPGEISAVIERLPHVWKSGDMYWKLAAQHYNDSQLWWVIAWYNKRPTESHNKLGDVIQIPYPLSAILSYIG